MRDYLTGSGLGPFLVRSVLGSGLLQTAGMAATFVVGILLARGLGVRGYGQYGIAMALISLAGLPGEFGLPKLVLRETAAASARKDWTAMFGLLRWADTVSLKLSMSVAALITASAGLLFFLGHEPVLSLAVLLGVPIIPLYALAKIRGATLQGLHHVVLGQVPPILLRPLLFACLLFTIRVTGAKLVPAAAMALNSLTAAAALVAAAAWLRIRLPTEQPAAPGITAEHQRRFLRSAATMGLSDALLAGDAQLTILLLGIFVPPDDVGLYRIAVSISVLLVLPTVVVNMTVGPVLATLYSQSKHVQLQRVITHSARTQLAGMLALSLPLAIFCGPILKFLFGPEFQSAAGTLRLIILGQAISSSFGPNDTLLNMAHHEKRVARAFFISLIATIPTVAILAPFYGKYGAAAAFVLSITIWNILIWHDCRQRLGIDTSVWPIRAEN